EAILRDKANAEGSLPQAVPPDRTVRIRPQGGQAGLAMDARRSTDCRLCQTGCPMRQAAMTSNIDRTCSWHILPRRKPDAERRGPFSPMVRSRPLVRTIIKMSGREHTLA